MKSLSQRERVMVTALPAAVILLCYYFFVAGSLGKERDRLRRDLDAALTRVPSLQSEVEVTVKRDALEAEEEILASESRALEAREATLRTHWDDRDARARAGALVGDLLAANGIVLVEEAVAGEPDRQRFRAALDPLPTAELWKLRIAGGFRPVAEMLAGLGESDLPILPAAIEMEPLAEGNRSVHLWSLWICR